MIISLSTISPIAFTLVNVGDRLQVERIKPKKNEYRDKIGSPKEALLVFKGQTKVGMIPFDIFSIIKIEQISKICRVSRMDKLNSIIEIDVNIKTSEF
jgi:hypothetical protein